MIHKLKAVFANPLSLPAAPASTLRSRSCGDMCPPSPTRSGSARSTRCGSPSPTSPFYGRSFSGKSQQLYTSIFINHIQTLIHTPCLMTVELWLLQRAGASAVHRAESARPAADPGQCPLEHLGSHRPPRLDQLAEPRHQHRQVGRLSGRWLNLGSGRRGRSMLASNISKLFDS